MFDSPVAKYKWIQTFYRVHVSGAPYNKFIISKTGISTASCTPVTFVLKQYDIAGKLCGFIT